MAVAVESRGIRDNLCGSKGIVSRWDEMAVSQLKEGDECQFNASHMLVVQSRAVRSTRARIRDYVLRRGIFCLVRQLLRLTGWSCLNFQVCEPRSDLSEKLQWSLETPPRTRGTRSLLGEAPMNQGSAARGRGEGGGGFGAGGADESSDGLVLCPSQKSAPRTPLW